jgi:hypothetical protein
MTTTRVPTGTTCVVFLYNAGTQKKVYVIFLRSSSVNSFRTVSPLLR